MTVLYFERSTAAAENPPTAVFLHGFMGSIEDWTPIRAELEGAFDCIFIDLPGHGQSPPLAQPKPDDRRPAVQQITDAILDVLDRESIEKPHIVGYSMGGRVALHLAICAPGRVKSLVLESTSPGLSGAAARDARAALDSRRADALRAHGLGAFLDDWYQAGLFESLRLHPRFDEMLRLRKKGDAAALATVIEAMSPGRQPDHWPHLPDLHISTLLLAGALDHRYTESTREAAALLPDAQFQIASDAGHNIHFEAPKWFIQVLTEFIS